MSDLRSYEILVLEHEAMLFSYLLALVRDRHMAEDLVQETFLQAYRKLSTLEKSSSFAAWVRSIGRNLAFNTMKRRKREVPTDPETLQGMEDVFGALDDAGLGDTWGERSRAVGRCFKQLPESMRRTCMLHYMEGYPVKVVAEKLTVSLASVLKRLERGRKAVRRCVERRLGLETL